MSAAAALISHRTGSWSAERSAAGGHFLCLGAWRLGAVDLHRLRPRIAVAAIWRTGVGGRAVGGPAVAEHGVTAGVLEVGADEPLEQLELTELPDEQVFGHRIDLAGLLHRAAVVFDDPAVHAIECGQMANGRFAIQLVVVPR